MPIVIPHLPFTRGEMKPAGCKSPCGMWMANSGFLRCDKCHDPQGRSLAEQWEALANYEEERPRRIRH